MERWTRENAKTNGRQKKSDHGDHKVILEALSFFACDICFKSSFFGDGV